ncbi:MAG: hypothetical protein ACI9MC_002198 [Kiritimatiellia bacterium]|jgi:hypothetical protein
MGDRRKAWTRRARAADRYWNTGIPLDFEVSERSPYVFWMTVERAGRPVLLRMARDETMLRSLREGGVVDADQVVTDVLAEMLPRLDPGNGVRLAIAKLQLAVLETLDRLYQDHGEEEDDLIDRDWADEHGLVDFL